MTIGMKVSKFFVENCKVVSGGQGNVTIHCEELWEMSDEEFEKSFLKDSSLPSQENTK